MHLLSALVWAWISCNAVGHGKLVISSLWPWRKVIACACTSFQVRACIRVTLSLGIPARAPPPPPFAAPQNLFFCNTYHPELDLWFRRHE